MRTLRFAFAAYLAAGVGNVFAQQFSTPSQLSYPSSRQQTPGLARYMEPAPKPMPVDQTEPAAPPVSGGMYSAPAGCDSCGMGASCGCGSSCGCGCGCGCCGNGYGSSFFGADGACWYGSVGGLVMTRSRNNPVEIAYNPNNVDSELLGSQQVSPNDWQGGFELRVGRYLGCDHRIEGVYWTLDPDNQTASASGQVASSLDFGRLEFNGSGVGSWFGNGIVGPSPYQQISMRSEFHNFELNLWGDHCLCDPCSRVQLSWLSGFRFFRFNERFDYASASQDVALGINPANDAYYTFKTENNLIGFQVGCEAEYRLGCRTSVFAIPRIGIFWNHSQEEVRLHTGDGIIANDLNGRRWDINSDANTFATIAQIDVGLNYQVTCNLQAYVGYRLVAASGVALSTEQIPQYASDYLGTQAIDTNGHLFLHGIQAGVNWRF